MTVVF